MDLAEINASNIFKHPWEISRTGNILSLVRELNLKGDLADIGAGDLYFANALKGVTGATVTAIDTAYSTFKPENPSGILLLNDISGVKNGSVSAAFLLDVLEHVEEQEIFLKEIAAKLAPEGILVVTVPAFNFLFGENDEFLKHKRRYSKAILRNVTERSGFATIETFYFFFSLFFVRLLEVSFRALGSKLSSKKIVSSWRLPGENFVTRVLVFTLGLDFKIGRRFSKLGISLPGLSLCAVLKRTSSL